MNGAAWRAQQENGTYIRVVHGVDPGALSMGVAWTMNVQYSMNS